MSGLTVYPSNGIESCAYDTLKEFEHVVVMYYDDDTVDDIPNNENDVLTGFNTGNAAYIGNTELLMSNLIGVKMCLEATYDSETCGDGTWTQPDDANGCMLDANDITYITQMSLDECKTACLDWSNTQAFAQVKHA